MAGHSSVMLEWNWTDLSVLGSQVFSQSLVESCALDEKKKKKRKIFTKHFTGVILK